MTIDPKVHWALHLVLATCLTALLVLQHNTNVPMASSTEKTTNVSKQQTFQDTQKTEQKVVQNSLTTRTETRKNGTQIRTVTRTGTQIDTRKQEEKKEEEKTATSIKESTKSVPLLVPEKSSYSLALSWSPLRLEPVPYLPAQATLGARLGQLPLFLEVAAPVSHPSLNQLMLGIRVEF